MKQREETENQREPPKLSYNNNVANGPQARCHSHKKKGFFNNYNKKTKTRK